MDRNGELREFVAARGAALSRAAYLLTGDRRAAEDLMQETYVVMVRQWRRIDSGNPEPYVRRIMYGRFVDGWRRRRHLVELPTAAPSDVSDPVDEAGRAVDRLTLGQALMSLTPRQRSVLVLRFYEDLTEAEVAHVLGVSTSTVKSQTRGGVAASAGPRPGRGGVLRGGTGGGDRVMDSLHDAMDAEASGIPQLGDIDRAIHDVTVARRWWSGVFGVAAAALVLLVALVGPAWRPLTMETAITPRPITPYEPRTSTGYFTGSNPLVTLSYVLPYGWVQKDGFLVDAQDAVVNFWDVGNVFADGCEWTLLDPPLGPTVDDLATVWAGLPGITATTPVGIMVGGYPGKLVEYTLPGYDDSDCHNGQFALWTDDNGSKISPSFWAQVPKQQNRQWIIDVDGTRLVINEWSHPGTTPEQLADMDQFLASIRIG